MRRLRTAIDAASGRVLTGLARLQQAVADILGTPLDTRVMRRNYGSLVPQLVDQPLNPTTRQRIFGAAAVALMRWEPELKLRRLGLEAGPAFGMAPGVAVITIEGEHPDAADPSGLVRLVVPLKPREPGQVAGAPIVL